ncbi:UNVERIFIED_ORG: hypothetical protein EDC92_1181, partial [Dietzia maris]
PGRHRSPPPKGARDHLTRPGRRPPARPPLTHPEGGAKSKQHSGAKWACHSHSIRVKPVVVALSMHQAVKRPEGVRSRRARRGRRDDEKTTRRSYGGRPAAGFSCSALGSTRRYRTPGVARWGHSRSPSRGRRLSTDSRAVSRDLRCHSGWAGMRGARCRFVGTVHRRHFRSGGVVGLQSGYSARKAASGSVDARRCISVVRRPRSRIPRCRCTTWHREDRAWVLGAGTAYFTATVCAGIGAWPTRHLVKPAAAVATLFATAPILFFPVHKVFGVLVAVVLTAPALGLAFAAALSSTRSASDIRWEGSSDD